MKIFVTGGTGFIGKALIPKLEKRRHQLLILTRNPTKQPSQRNLSFITGNLQNISQWQKTLQKFQPEAALHLAWEGIPDHSVAVSRANLEYGLNLTKLLAEIGCKRLVITGSCYEYGQQTGKLSEDTIIKPFDAFTAAKNSLNWLGQETAKENNMEFIWTRLFYVYGPNQRAQSLIPYLISCAQTKRKPELRNPDAQNDFIYVEDVAEALCQLLEGKQKKAASQAENSVYNIGSGKLNSVSNIMEIIFKQFGIKSGYKKAKQVPKDALGYIYADISKIKKDTGWEPKTDIKQGIKKMISQPAHTVS